MVLNEQISSVQGQNGSITVNALHVTAPGVADALVSTAVAVIEPLLVFAGGGGGGNCQDFVTGGGWITTPEGAKANFGVAGGMRNGAPWGHLEYIDHRTGMKVHGTGVTDYSGADGTNTRIIKGNALIDGEPVTYIVQVTDNGEPGRNDMFTITLSNGYMAGGTLGPTTKGGGNI